MPPGETTEEYRRTQLQEADTVEQDKATGSTTGRGLLGVALAIAFLGVRRLLEMKQMA